MMDAHGAFAAALQEFGCGSDEDSLLLGEGQLGGIPGVMNWDVEMVTDGESVMGV